MEKPNPRPNTAYYNFKLLEELDYVIGGHGPANQEFIFNFNNFVESFVLNENFLFSNQEWNHFFLTSTVIRPNGKPITELVLTQKNGFERLSFPFFMIKGTAMHVQEVPSNLELQDVSNIYLQFQEKNSKYLQDRFSKPIEFNSSESNYPFLLVDYMKGSKPQSKRFVIFETSTTPKKLLNGLYDALPNSNFQTTLSITGLKAQLDIQKGLGISKQTIGILKKLHNSDIEQVINLNGYKKIPIPPLVSILLSQCKSMDDIPEKLLQLRSDFQALRKSFIEYEQNLSQAENLNEQFEINRKYNEFWIAFNRKNKINTHRLMFQFWDLAKEGKLMESFEQAIDSNNFDEFVNDLSFTKMGAKGVSKVFQYFKDRKALNRFKGVTDLWELFKKSPTLENQVKDFERIFGIKVNIKELNQIAKSVKNN